ncbi:MAG: accessory factor UbiK family protein [Sphingomonadales bacterium]
MQTDNPFIDDLSKLATGAVGTLSGVKQEIEAAVKLRVERLASEMNLVPREEFEVVREMVILAREENEALKTRLDVLENSKRTKLKPKK